MGSAFVLYVIFLNLNFIQIMYSTMESKDISSAELMQVSAEFPKLKKNSFHALELFLDTESNRIRSANFIMKKNTLKTAKSKTEIEIFACSASSETEQSFAKKGKKEDLLFLTAYSTCEKDLKPVIYRFMDHSTNIHRKYNEYSCGYMVYVPNNLFKEVHTSYTSRNIQFALSDIQYVEIYKFAYHFDSSETIYTKHKILLPGLLNLENGYPRTSLYKLVIHEAFDSRLRAYKNWYKKSLFQETINRLNQLFDSPVNKFLVKQMLVPYQDMALEAWKRATFAWVNIKPQFNVVVKQWKKINNFIRKQVTEKKLKLFIYTGTEGRIRQIIKKALFRFKTYTGNFDQAMIPANWWKMVVNMTGTEGILIVMSNNPYLKPEQNEQLCSTNTSDLCLGAGWGAIKNDAIIGYTYCCKVTSDLMKKLLGISFQNLKPLIIDTDSTYHED